MIAKIKAAPQSKILFRNLALKRLYNMPMRMTIDTKIGKLMHIAIMSTIENGLLMYESE
ncbi:hypothetical protein NSA56_00575 [Oceanobacillus caeni]|uniref:hypothetical protein n=1 Tax=Bacillaceae TaxID=186817 RepID=UPI0013F4C41D|nr:MULTISPECIES: hypothetical protein [Bacillaceae]MBU8789328.1 hypothetical protein [Oceanobacillus caeni]MCR1832888.1 hypothetical protein [Oceanobacillus caeni]